MTPFKDVSTKYCTVLKAVTGRGRARKTFHVRVPGTDIWAYQMARIQLHNDLAAHLRLARVAGSGPAPR